MEEMVAAKQAVQDVLKISPEDIQLHRIHGMYTGHILDIRKTMMQEAAVDRDQLLIDALKGVVNFLLEKGEGESAGFIGTKYVDSSHGKSRPSAKPRQSKKKTAKSTRKKI
jgi:hypothetical protein